MFASPVLQSALRNLHSTKKTMFAEFLFLSCFRCLFKQSVRLSTLLYFSKHWTDVNQSNIYWISRIMSYNYKIHVKYWLEICIYVVYEFFSSSSRSVHIFLVFKIFFIYAFHFYIWLIVGLENNFFKF